MNGSFSYYIREASKEDESFLWEMLYQCLYVPPNEPPPDRSIIHQPELSKYIKDWGLKDDYALIGIDKTSNQRVGAIWLRLFKENDQGYGYVDNHTPELSMAILLEFRGKGLGTELLSKLLQYLRENKYKTVSLSVSPNNPAKRLYEKMEFKDTGIISGTSITMRNTLK